MQNQKKHRLRDPVPGMAIEQMQKTQENKDIQG
jgi:hypothetical protein